MSKILVTIKIRCGEFVFKRHDVIDQPKGMSVGAAIKQYYSEDATDIDKDTYYYANDEYCYTIKNAQALTPAQAIVLDELGVQ